MKKKKIDPQVSLQMDPFLEDFPRPLGMTSARAPVFRPHQTVGGQILYPKNEMATPKNCHKVYFPLSNFEKYKIPEIDRNCLYHGNVTGNFMAKYACPVKHQATSSTKHHGLHRLVHVSHRNHRHGRHGRHGPSQAVPVSEEPKCLPFPIKILGRSSKVGIQSLRSISIIL